jgi:CHAT domain-containing protein
MYGAQLISVRFGQPITEDTTQRIEDRVRAQMTTQVGDGWAILRYAWQNNDLLWRFLITPDVFEVSPIPITRELRFALDACTGPDESFRRRIYGNENDSLGQQDRRALYEALLPASLHEHCLPDQPLIIIPSRSLYQLPFHSLLDGDNHPLIEQAEVVYAASLDLLQESADAASAQGLVRAGGLICAQDTFTDSSSLNPLVYAMREAELVRSVMGDHTEIRTKGEFQREALDALDQNGVLGAMRWLHFITHSQYDHYSGAFMGLATEAGSIRVEDILRWKTHADLVTLSACQTGVGHARLGDEIEGMIQAFLSGGAQNVIASLWLVGDNENSLWFIEQLYQTIVDGYSPAQALASVQRQAIERNLPAHQWAPFFLTGRPTSHARSAPQDAPHPVS